MIGSKIVTLVTASLLASGVALAQSSLQAPNEVDPFDPGAAGSPPGPGCQVGTSGCFPSAPPGPQTPPADPGADTVRPPPIVNPKDVPFYGTLPGPAGRLEEPQATPDAQAQIRADEEEAHRDRIEQLLEQQTEELAAQREQLQNQNDQLAADREQLEGLRQQLEEQKKAAEKSGPPAKGAERPPAANPTAP